jgi:hypothetical protein
MSKTALAAGGKAVIPADIRTLFGPPPVLASEDAKQYEDMLLLFAQCVRPQDIFEWFLVNDVTNARSEIQRMRRLKASLMDYEKNARLETYHRLEMPKPAEDAHAGSVPRWGASFELLDRMQAAAERRFQVAVEQLDIHKQGRGLRLRKVSDEIIDVEFEEPPVTADAIKPIPEHPTAPVASGLASATPSDDTTDELYSPSSPPEVRWHRPIPSTPPVVVRGPFSRSSSSSATPRWPDRDQRRDGR